MPAGAPDTPAWLVLPAAAPSDIDRHATVPERRAWLVRDRAELSQLPQGVALNVFAEAGSRPLAAGDSAAHAQGGPYGAMREAQPLLQLPGGVPFALRVFVLLPGLSPLRAYVHGAALALTPADWDFTSRPMAAMAAAAEKGEGAAKMAAQSKAAPAREAAGVANTTAQADAGSQRPWAQQTSMVTTEQERREHEAQAAAEVARAFSLAHLRIPGCTPARGSAGNAARCLSPRVAWHLAGGGSAARACAASAADREAAAAGLPCTFKPELINQARTAPKGGARPTLQQLDLERLLAGGARAAITSLELSNLGIGSLGGAAGPVRAAVKRAASQFIVQLWREAMSSEASGHSAAAADSVRHAAEGARAGARRLAKGASLGLDFQLLSLDLVIRADGASAHALSGSLEPRWATEAADEDHDAFGGSSGERAAPGGQAAAGVAARFEDVLLGDLLNLTGAALHPTQRRLRHDLLQGLRRAFAVRPLPSRVQASTSRSAARRRAAAARGLRGSPKVPPGRHDMPVPHQPIAPELTPEARCKYALPARRQPRSAAQAASQPPPPPPLEGGPCIDIEELAALAHLETEHNWRHGFQRLDVAERMHALEEAGERLPRARMDALLAEYSSRWAQEELRGARRP